MKIFVQIIIALLFINISFSQTNYYVATTGSDANDGGQLQPWATIEHAVNSVSNPASDIIIINVAAGVYDLSNNQIDINRGFTNLIILGTSIDNTIIQSASDTSLSTSRVFKIYAGNTVILKNMTIRNGRANDDGDGIIHGAGIFNLSSNLTIENCIITENVSGSTGKGYGVGISNIRGTLIVSNSTISHNIGSFSTSLPCYGGGIASVDGSLIISNSTISFNTAPGGGGIAIISEEGNSLNSNFEITNSTISENRGYNSYGGIRISRWGASNSKTITASFNSCTVFQNYAGIDQQNLGFYGGIAVNSDPITTEIQINIKNSIFAGNKSDVNNSNPSLRNIDLSFQSGIGTINSDGYNIIQNYDGEAISGQINNGIGIDPNLQSLADNSSLNGTQTCAALLGSPAIDVILVGGNGAPLLDQRGFQRDGNFDIGAYEYLNLSEINDKKQFPGTFSLDQNYPNPFNPSTKIRYTIPTSPLNPSPYQGEGQGVRLVTLKVYDVLGNEVATLINEYKLAGSYEIEFSAIGGSASGGNAYNLPSGIYFYRLQAGSVVQTRKMILIK